MSNPINQRYSFVSAKISVSKVADAGDDVELLIDLWIVGCGQDFDFGKGVGDCVDSGLGHQQRQQYDSV